jgi:chain length determinant protein EpsF
MTLREILLILKARRWLVLGLFGAIFGAAVAASLLLPKQYAATTTVIADPKAPDPVYGMMVQNGAMLGSSFIATQVDVITSERIARRVVRALGLAENEQARAKWQAEGGGKGTVEQYFAQLLAKHLDVRPARESNVITIQYTATEPQFAALVANAFAKAYVDTTSDLRSDPAKTSVEFFDARAKQLREELEAAQQKLSSYQQLHRITVTDERLDVEAARLSQLTTQMTTVQALRSESSSRRRQASSREASSPDVLHNPVVESLRTDVARADARLQELGGRLGHNHPEYQAARAEVDSLNSRLRLEMSKVAESVTTADAVNAQRESEAAAQLDSQRNKILELRSQRDAVAILQRDVEESQKAYDLVVQRLNQTSLESKNQQTIVAILSEALPPTSPSSPKVLLNLAVSTVLGLLLGVMSALLLEQTDRRLRGAEDAANHLGLPLLAALPAAKVAPPPITDGRGLRLLRLGAPKRAPAAS